MASYTNTQTKCSLFNELDQEQPRTYPDACAALLFLCAVKHGDISTTSRLDLTANTGPGPVRDGGGRVRLGSVRLYSSSLSYSGAVCWAGLSTVRAGTWLRDDSSFSVFEPGGAVFMGGVVRAESGKEVCVGVCGGGVSS